MLWKEFKCKACGHVIENFSCRPEDTSIECKECGGEARVVITPKPTRFKGAGWQTKRPIETFPDEPDDPAKWDKDSHGVEASLKRGQTYDSY